MRRILILTLLVFLGACIPRVERSSAPAPERPVSRPPAVAPDLLQCHLMLAREDVDFRILADRRFEGGCSALGSVQLLEIGTPVTNLGAMTCLLARQFALWVRNSVQPAARRHLGVPVRRVETFGTYACRSVNSRPGARISEHGKANAVDVAAFELADGRRLTVEKGWNGDEAKVRHFLREIHQAGCRQFNIAIGPDGDSYHYNHLHFDMGRGPYCR